MAARRFGDGLGPQFAFKIGKCRRTPVCHCYPFSTGAIGMGFTSDTPGGICRGDVDDISVRLPCVARTLWFWRSTPHESCTLGNPSSFDVGVAIRLRKGSSRSPHSSRALRTAPRSEDFCRMHPMELQVAGCVDYRANIDVSRGACYIV